MVEFFPFNSHLLGDSAYPLGQHILVPFKDNGHLSRKQVKYNTLHAASRSVIERVFAYLKGRWRRLKYLELHNTYFLPDVIMAACILHNFCLQQKDHVDDVNASEENDLETYDENVTEIEDSRNGFQKRNDIVNNL